MPRVKVITDENSEENLFQNPAPAVLYLWNSAVSGEDRDLAVLEEIGTRYAGKIRTLSCDLNKNPSMSRADVVDKLSLHGRQAFLLFVGGRWTGLSVPSPVSTGELVTRLNLEDVASAWSSQAARTHRQQLSAALDPTFTSGGDRSIPRPVGRRRTSLLPIAAVGLVLVLVVAAFAVFRAVESGGHGAGGGGATACQDPSISLSPNTGASGTHVVVRGNDFPANSNVELLFSTEDMTPARTDNKGTFQGEVVIPNSYDNFAPHQFGVTAETTSSVCFASAPFELTK